MVGAAGIASTVVAIEFMAAAQFGAPLYLDGLLGLEGPVIYPYVGPNLDNSGLIDRPGLRSKYIPYRYIAVIWRPLKKPKYTVYH